MCRSVPFFPSVCRLPQLGSPSAIRTLPLGLLSDLRLLFCFLPAFSSGAPPGFCLHRPSRFILLPSGAPSALFFSITQAKRKRDPKAARKDMWNLKKAIIKAAGIGRRQPVKNNDEEQSFRLHRIFMIALNRINVNNIMLFCAQKTQKNIKNLKKPLTISHTYDIMYMQSGRAPARSFSNPWLGGGTNGVHSSHCDLRLFHGSADKAGIKENHRKA